MNTLTAIFKVKNGMLIKVPDLIKSIIHEAVLVANKEGLNYNEEEMYENVMKIIQDSAENQSSMLQDILKGRKTEIDYLNGAVVELGKKYGIKCPVNETLIRIVKGMEKQ
jgi:2-dehydropantoate 2-reductase